MSFMTAELSNQIPAVLIMLSIICVVGTTGNMLVIVVYALKHDRLTSTLFILVLAVTDFLACLTLIPGTIAIEYFEWKMRSAFLCKSYYLLNNSFIPFSSLLISCIAFDRYFCLCHPFAKIMTFVRAKRIIAVLVFACLFQGACSTFLVRIEKVKSDEFTYNFVGNATDLTGASQLTNVTTSDTYECTEVIRVNATALEYVWYRVTQKIQIVSYVFCILSVTVLYILIYSSVSKVFKKRKKLIGHRSKCSAVRTECYQASQFEPEVINGQAEQCKSTSHLDVHVQRPRYSEPSNLRQNIHRTADATVLPNATITPSIHRNATPIILLTSETDDSADTTNLNAIKVQQNQEFLTTSSNPSLNNMSFNQTGQFKRIPKMFLHAENSSCGKQIPIEPEGRSGVFGGERSKKPTRNLADSVTFQNLKTAAMLFVVAIVYIVAFLPAMLMANELITLYLPIFYLYYVNNAINPIVYGFMNPNFRADIKKLFTQRSRCL